MEQHPPGFNQLIKAAKKLEPDGKQLRVALLGDSAIQLLAKAIHASGRLSGLSVNIYEADYDQIDLQVLSHDSALYTFRPDFIIIYHSVSKLKNRFYSSPLGIKTEFHEHHSSKIENLVRSVASKCSSKIIYLNLPTVQDAIFGNYATKVETSLRFHIRAINQHLNSFASGHGQFFICDVESLAAYVGLSHSFDQQLYITSDMEFSLDFQALVASNVIDIINAVHGKINKCLILDLDNTLWGGVIGDDGIDGIEIGNFGLGKAFVDFQLWIRQLKDRGIILCICSKNTEAIAFEPFRNHPDMVLKEDDIAVFVANWNNKADNIQYIQKVLNIGFDSMVFIDDNPFERNLVRNAIPDICVPELPEDPSEYVDFLSQLNLFEVASFSTNDQNRNQQYREEAQRKSIEIQFTNQDDYLKSLEMVAVIEPFNSFNIPRVAQLTQRSNQFNFRTKRYTESDIKSMAESERFIPLIVSLSDKFGDYGIVSVVILEKNTSHLFIDTWIMSCRVLKRGLEDLVLNQVINHAEFHGAAKIYGEYLATPKNILVRDFFPEKGFKQEGELWKCETSTYQIKQHFISLKEVNI